MEVCGRGCVKRVFFAESLVNGGRGFAGSANAHLGDDETVAKMGHPRLDVGYPPGFCLEIFSGGSFCVFAGGFGENAW
jgi:hypothetical protein